MIPASSPTSSASSSGAHRDASRTWRPTRAAPPPAPLCCRYKGALCVAYIDDVEGKKKTNLPTEAAPEKTFYSCLIDGTQRDGNGRLKKDAEGRLAPTYIIELPGVPILGNGKSDNQNCALPFTRGPILQAIDCNQEAAAPGETAATAAAPPCTPSSPGGRLLHQRCSKAATEPLGVLAADFARP